MTSLNTLAKFILNVKSYVYAGARIITDLHERACIIFSFDFRKNHVHRCAICQKKLAIYDTRKHKSLWRAPDWNGVKIYIEAPTVRVDCPEHGVHQELVPWAPLQSDFTYDFDAEVTWMAAQIHKTAAKEFYDIAWPTVGHCMERCKDRIEPDSTVRFNGLINIGIDETSVAKGHTYITTVINHDTGELVWAAQGHDEATLSRFFLSLSPEQRASIQVVSGDGARWIDNCIQRFCPQATRCLDTFHVVQWANDAIDELRKLIWRQSRQELSEINDEYKNQIEKIKQINDESDKTKEKEKLDELKQKKKEAEKKVRKIKGSKFALGKAPENLTADQAKKLEYVQETDKQLKRAYELKELLRTLLQLSLDHAQEALKKFFWRTSHCRIPIFQELGEKIKRHEQHILNTISTHINNARVEGINRKIKGVLNKAYGFRNIDNMISMLMLVVSNLSAPLAHRPNGGLRIG